MKEAVASQWFDETKFFSPEQLTGGFRKTFSILLSQPRGGGYYIWMLDILEQASASIADGDLIVYCDAGNHLNSLASKRFHEYVDMLYASDHTTLSFQMPHIIEQQYTTKDCFDAFHVPRSSPIRTTGQITSCAFLAKKGKQWATLLREFRHVITLNPLIITNYYDQMQESYFVENRHDQSVISILFKKYGSIMLADETYFPAFAGVNSMIQASFQIKAAQLARRVFGFPVSPYQSLYAALDCAIHVPFWALRLRE